jgi:DNA mismatch repair ATPase MutS
MLIEEIKHHFLLPIEMNEFKKEIFKNLNEDLELLSSQENEKNSSSVYENIFKPKTNIARNNLEKWSKYYTTDSRFLKDTQTLLKKYNSGEYKQEIVEDWWNKWREIKEMDQFLETYQYIEWEKLQFLNESELFLSILTFYQTISPVLSLMAPFILLLIPFIILKVLKRPITITQYFVVLRQQLDKHSMGQLFTRFDALSWGQRTYLMMCCGMYAYQIYQNALACYRFYKNTKEIGNTFKLCNDYLKYTESHLKNYIKHLEQLKSYQEYHKYLSEKLCELQKLQKIIHKIAISSYNPTKFALMGKIMKEFYLLQSSPKVKEILLFSFGFNGYIENIQQLQENIQYHFIHTIKIINHKKPKMKMKQLFHPNLTSNHIANTIDIHKSKIITGPNAAGKTTILKATIINVILAQQIGYGYHKGGYITPFDYIHCYLNIPDTNGRDSLFQAEARRCRQILEEIQIHKDKKHFCIFDELFSGTNPYEAIATAYGYLDYISKNKNVKFLLTTHYIDLCKLLDKHKTVSNYQMETYVHDNIPKYTYKIIKGISKIKGGIMVLKQLNYPDAILDKSHTIIDML